MVWIAVGLCLLNAVVSFARAGGSNKPDAAAAIAYGALWVVLAVVAILINK